MYDAKKNSQRNDTKLAHSCSSILSDVNSIRQQIILLIMNHFSVYDVVTFDHVSKSRPSSITVKKKRFSFHANYDIYRSCCRWRQRFHKRLAMNRCDLLSPFLSALTFALEAFNGNHTLGGSNPRDQSAGHFSSFIMFRGLMVFVGLNVWKRWKVTVLSFFLIIQVLQALTKHWSC